MDDNNSEQGFGRTYRVKLRKPGGGIETTIAIMVDTLPEVKQQAEDLAGIYEVEIWEDGQMVLRLPCKSGR